MLLLVSLKVIEGSLLHYWHIHRKVEWELCFWNPMSDSYIQILLSVSSSQSTNGTHKICLASNKTHNKNTKSQWPSSTSGLSFLSQKEIREWHYYTPIRTLPSKKMVRNVWTHNVKCDKICSQILFNPQQEHIKSQWPSSSFGVKLH